MKKIIALSLLASGILLAKTPSCDTPELKGMVDGINQSVPMQVDSDTTLVAARCDKGELIYVYKLNENSQINNFNELQLNVTKNITQNILKQNYCGGNPEVEALKTLTNAVVWEYKFADDKDFTQIRLTPANCK